MLRSVWIGANDIAERGSWVWSDDEPLTYSNWVAQHPSPSSQSTSAAGDAAAMWDIEGGRWLDVDALAKHAYICGKTAAPSVASGGFMRGCEGGRWLMGTPYGPSLSGTSRRLPPTLVFGILEPEAYDDIVPPKKAINQTVSTAAECAALVHRDHPRAAAAEFSNAGQE